MKCLYCKTEKVLDKTKEPYTYVCIRCGDIHRQNIEEERYKKLSEEKTNTKNKKEFGGDY